MHESQIVVPCPVGGASYAVTDEEERVFLIPPKEFKDFFDEMLISDLVRQLGAEGVATSYIEALHAHGWRAVIRLV